MKRVALLDVNVLVALFDTEHVHHEVAHDWFEDHRDDGWATCPMTENGFVRIASALSPPDSRLLPGRLAEQLRRFCGSRGHHFWGDVVSLRDPAIFDLSYVFGPSQLSDVYLLGLARKMRGKLATFDRSIPMKAVLGASTETLAVIGTA